MLSLLFLCLLSVFVLGLAWGLIKFAFVLGAGIGCLFWVFFIIVIIGILATLI